jgi:hypothetical protein
MDKENYKEYQVITPTEKHKREFRILENKINKGFELYSLIKPYGWKPGEDPEDYLKYLGDSFSVGGITTAKIAYLVYQLFLYQVGNIDKKNFNSLTTKIRLWEAFNGKEELERKIREYFDKKIFKEECLYRDKLDIFIRELKKMLPQLYKIILKNEFSNISEKSIRELLKPIKDELKPNKNRRRKSNYCIKKQRKRYRQSNKVSQMIFSSKVVSSCTNPALKGKRIKYVLV